MKKLIVLFACAALTVWCAGEAAAQELRGRVALNAKLGVIDPADSEKGSSLGNLVVSSDAGIIGGGGILYGLDDNVAVELEVTHASFRTSGLGTAGVTDVSIGPQFRFPERQRLIPYLGAGVDILVNSLTDRTTDTVVGGHIAGGFDYMLLRDVALNAEIRGVKAISSDVRDFTGVKEGSFDPSNISFTVGARFFFN